MQKFYFQIVLKILEKMNSYVNKLTGDVQRRYMEKIKVINSVDPYDLNIHSPFYVKNFSEVPEITWIDIENYFISTKSFSTRDSLKAYKSLEAVKYVDAGFVYNLFGFRMYGYFVIKGNVCINFIFLYVKFTK